MAAEDNINVQVTADVDNLTSGMDQVAASTDASMNDAVESINRLASALEENLAGAAEKAKEKVHEVGEEAFSIGEKFEELKHTINTAFEAGGILLAVEAIHKVGEALEEAMAHATQINNMSDVLGISVEEFQALEEASNKAGVNLSIVSRTAIRLEEDFRKAGAGNDEIRQKLFDLGFTIEQIGDKSFTSSQMIKTLADNLRNSDTAMDGITAAFGARAKLVAEALKEYDGSEQGLATAMQNVNGLTKEQAEELHKMHGFWSDVGSALGNATAKLLLWTAAANDAGAAGESFLSGGDVSEIVVNEEKKVDAAKVAAAQRVAAELQAKRAAVESAKDILMATKAGTEERLQAEKDYITAVVELDGQRSDTYKKAIRELAKDTDEYNTKNAEDEAKYSEIKLHAAEKYYAANRESAKKAVSEMDKDFKEYFDNLTKEQIDVAQGTEKVTLSQLDSAKRILDSKNQQKDLSPSEYLSGEVAIINQRRDAEIKMYHDIAAARGADKDAAVKEQQDIMVANARAATQITAAQLKASQEVAKNWQAVDNTIERSLDGAFRTMLTSTATFTATVNRAFLNLSENLIENIFNSIVKKWVEGETTKLAASQTVQSALAALHLTGLVTAKATDATMAASDITTKAAQAAAGAYAATAAIPYVGPILAPAAAAEADASVMAFMGQIAFEKGGIVPSTQTALVHKDEMVLPADISKGIQETFNMNGHGQSSGGGGGGGDHYTIQAHDAKSFEKYVGNQRNRNALVKAMSKAGSRGNPSLRGRM